MITITSIYLSYRIIKSKNFFHSTSVKRNAALERKSRKAGRLAEILQEQVKPPMAVFRVGGIDAVLDILTAVIIAAAFLVSQSNIMMTFIVIGPIIGITIEYLQLADHWLVYNIDIREKMIDCIRARKKRSSHHTTQRIITK